MRAVEEEGGGLARPEARTFGEVKKGYTSFLSGDVIMAKITPCMENGKTTVVPDVAGEVCFGSTEFHVLRPELGVQARWLAQFLLQHDVRHVAQRKMTGGVGQMRVPAAFLDEARIPLSPALEQIRIADMIDELLSDLDAGVGSLKHASGKLKVYRDSVLKTAIEGQLTAAWRTKHPDIGSASELLDSILSERRRQWEEDQLKKFKAMGKEPARNWKDKYEKPVAPDLTDLPPIPTGWSVASMDMLTTRITSGSRDWQQHYGTGTGTFIMAQNVRPGFFDRSFRQVVNPPRSDSSCERSLVEIDDILVTIVGANTGDVCRIPKALAEHYVCQSVALTRPADRQISKYLDYYFNSPSGAQLHFRRYTYGAGRPHLSFDQLKMTPVLLPPLVEQEAIVELVEDQISVVDHIKSDLNAKLNTAQSLRQAVLHHAFSGKLLPQDPDDEPAAELLRRIAVERATRTQDVSKVKQPMKRKAKAK